MIEANSKQQFVGWYTLGFALTVHIGNRLVNGAIEMIEIGAGLVREKVTLQVAPGSLDVIPLRSIFRQPFDRQPRARGQGRLGGFTGMDWTVVKNEGDRLWGRPGHGP